MTEHIPISNSNTVQHTSTGNCQCFLCTNGIPDCLKTDAPTWCSILKVTLFCLSVKCDNNLAYHKHKQIFDFIGKHWQTFKVGNRGGISWKKACQDALSHNPQFFESGQRVMKKTGFWRLLPFRSPWCVIKTQPTSEPTVVSGSSQCSLAKRRRGRPKKVHGKTFSSTQGPHTVSIPQYCHTLPTLDSALMSLSPIIPPASPSYCPMYYFPSNSTPIASLQSGSISPTAPLSPIAPLSPVQLPEPSSRTSRPAALRLNTPETEQPLAAKRKAEEESSVDSTRVRREKLTDFKLDAEESPDNKESYSEAVEGLCKLFNRSYVKPQFDSCCSTRLPLYGCPMRTPWNFVNSALRFAPYNKLQLLCDVALGTK